MSLFDHHNFDVTKSAIVQMVQIGPITIIQGDMRDVLPELDEKAHLVVSDPPYPLTQGGNAEQVMSGIFSHENYNNDGNLMDMVPWHDMSGPIFRACRCDADAYIMANAKNQFMAQAAFMKAGWKFHNLLVWHKIRATRSRWYMKDCEFTIYLWKGKATRINDCGSKQLFPLNNIRKRSAHPTEKPVELFMDYIRNSSNEGDMVIDPFAGSGTVGLACLQLRRRCVLIELNIEYYGMAVKSITEAYQASLAA